MSLSLQLLIWLLTDISNQYFSVFYKIPLLRCLITCYDLPATTTDGCWLHLPLQVYLFCLFLIQFLCGTFEGKIKLQDFYHLYIQLKKIKKNSTKYIFILENCDAYERALIWFPSNMKNCNKKELIGYSYILPLQVCSQVTSRAENLSFLLKR